RNLFDHRAGKPRPGSEPGNPRPRGPRHGPTGRQLGRGLCLRAPPDPGRAGHAAVSRSSLFVPLLPTLPGLPLPEPPGFPPRPPAAPSPAARVKPFLTGNTVFFRMPAVLEGARRINICLPASPRLDVRPTLERKGTTHMRPMSGLLF